jgi:hypothetical protein
LHPTHCEAHETIGEIPPGGDQPVDVFVYGPLVRYNPPGHQHPVEVVDPNNHVKLKLMGSPPCLFEIIPRDRRLELLIGVYPTEESGKAHERWFYIVPQPDGNVVFSADGPYEPASI